MLIKCWGFSVYVTSMNILWEDKSRFSLLALPPWCNLLTPHADTSTVAFTHRMQLKCQLHTCTHMCKFTITFHPGVPDTRAFSRAVYSICKIKLSPEWNLEKATRSHFIGLSKEMGDRPFEDLLRIGDSCIWCELAFLRPLHQSTLILPFTYNPVTLPCVSG